MMSFRDAVALMMVGVVVGLLATMQARMGVGWPAVVLALVLSLLLVFTGFLGVLALTFRAAP